jgi:L-lactate utilization protein LutB
MDDYEDFMDSQKTESEWQKAIDDLKGAQNKTISDLDEKIDAVKNKLEELGLK